MKKSKWNELEVALLVLLAVCLLTGAAALRRQDDLQQKMIRLHVVANSDSERDQALKLQVRDKVLDFTEQTMRSAESREAANEALRASLPEIERMAEDTLLESGCADSVEARLEPAEFPLKAYDGFRLPAGEYMALRVLIGEAEGQNWWCCLFPPLCLSAATAKQDNEDAFIRVGLTKDQYGIITETGKTKYKVRFKILEVLEDWFG